jgi:uncharacterized repeat protein (TIGR03806 family)
VFGLCAGFTAWLVAAMAALPASAVDYFAADVTRPSNTRCVAGAPPASGDSVVLEQAFTETRGLEPFAFHRSPDDPDRFYFSARSGQLYTMRPNELATPQKPADAPRVVLDIGNRIGALQQSNAFTWGGSEEWGLVSFAFHPDFPTKPYVYAAFTGKNIPPGMAFDEVNPVSYLSRFTLANPANPAGPFDAASEVVMIRVEQPDGWLHHFDHVQFGPDGYLYLSSGDGVLNGAPNKPKIKAQDLTDFHGKLLRLDVNVADAQYPKGYRPAPGNPFSDGAGPILEEIYAYGFRNPWRFYWDVGAGPTGGMWLTDVGDADYEEINRIADLDSIGDANQKRAAANYGWPVFEGNWCRDPDICAPCANPRNCTLPGYTRPVFTYDQSLAPGSVAGLVGAGVYRGPIQDLVGKFIYVIYPSNEYYTLSPNGTGGWISQRIMPSAPESLISYFTDKNGNLYGTFAYSGARQNLFKFAFNGTGGTSVPQRLVDTGCVNPSNPKVAAPGLIPYTINAPLWSDNAFKGRWFAIPDGTNLWVRPDGSIGFPNGSVLMKKFSFGALNHETRLLMRHTDGVWRGYTYEWNEQQQDHVLVGATGLPGKQLPNGTTWDYPSRAQCDQCHTEAAGNVLGAEVGQLNGLFTYFGRTTGNQLSTWEEMGYFRPGLGLKEYGDAINPNKPNWTVQDLPAYPLVTFGHQSIINRTRAYLHSNCGSCHRPGSTGQGRANIDWRFSALNLDKALSEPNLTTLACNEPEGLVAFGGLDIIEPGNADQSVAFLRASRRGMNQMPPLATNILHTAGVNAIRAWINRADVCGNAALAIDSNGDGKFDKIRDTDNDSIPDNADNCRERANRSQVDSDRDKFGNACDGDFNNDLLTNGADLQILENAKGTACGAAGFVQFGTAGYVEAYDLNMDGRLDNADCGLFETLRNNVPGPSALR